MKIAIVCARFNEMITEKLLDSCTQELIAQGVKKQEISVFMVPGACEIPFMAQYLAEEKMYDGIITLGAVIRGETPHFDYVCKMVQEGVLSVTLNYTIPVIFGVLTTENIAQALDRADENKKNKGASFARALIDTLKLI